MLALGSVVGWLLARWVERLVAHEDALEAATIPPGEPRLCDEPELLSRRGRALLAIGVTALLFALFHQAVIRLRCQEIPESGAFDWIHLRIGYHLVLIALLVAATATDLRRYIIPDQVTASGMLFGVAVATLQGNLHLVPLWIDWNEEIPGIRGGYIPEWIRQHDHWHGFAWSLTGLVAGAVLTWLLRKVSSLLMGQEALGFGDVTLMGMIGSFIGWQAIVFVFLLAPICGLAGAVITAVTGGRTYVPYGPPLALAAVVVLFSWRWLWTPTRTIFGDWPSLAMLGGITFGGLIVLLGLLQLYRRIPGKNR